MDFSFQPSLRRRIVDNLGAFARRAYDGEPLRRAAVALVVTRCEDRDDACILLTLRPRHMNRHSGQFALPGGRLDQGETVRDAALRELHEELGLNLPQDRVLGMLDDYPTRSGFCITPLVMWGGANPALSPDANEVERVYRIPFDELNSPTVPDLSEPADGGPPVLSAMIPNLGGRVYAPTAAMLYQFREVAIRGADTRVAHYGQPEFAWK